MLLPRSEVIDAIDASHAIHRCAFANDTGWVYSVAAT
jgi:hypothetical protein